MTDPGQTGLVVGVGATPDGSAGHVTGYVTSLTSTRRWPRRPTSAGA